MKQHELVIKCSIIPEKIVPLLNLNCFFGAGGFKLLECNFNWKLFLPAFLIV